MTLSLSRLRAWSLRRQATLKEWFTGRALAQMLGWARKGFWAVMDQGLFSGANFLVNILLARWLAPDEYGAFAVAFAIFLFLSGFHNALLLEPMSVIGPSRYPNHIEIYLSAQRDLHFALTLPLAILTALAGLLLQVTGIGNPWLAQALIGSGIALPLILLLWTVRRMFYTLKRPASALFSSAFYALFLGAGLWGIHVKNMDSSLMAFAWMGIASFLSSVIAGGRLLAGQGGSPRLSWNEVLREHWGYGKWVLAAGVLTLATGQLQTFLLAGLLNLEAAGAFRAMQNFMLPMAQAVTAIATLGLPVLAYDYGQGDLRSLHRKGLFIFLGRKLNGNYQGEMGNRFNKRWLGTRIKHQMGPLSIKMYDKFRCILRIEPTVNNVAFFKHYRQVRHRGGSTTMCWAPMKKTIHSLPALRELLFATNQRYLKFISAIATPQVGVEKLHKLPETKTENQHRHKGFNLFSEEDTCLFRSLLQGEFFISGLTNKQLRNQYLPDKSASQVTRLLKRLRVHGMIKKVGKCYKYYLTDFGHETATMALKLREMVVIPTLAYPANSPA